MFWFGLILACWVIGLALGGPTTVHRVLLAMLGVAVALALFRILWAAGAASDTLGSVAVGAAVQSLGLVGSICLAFMAGYGRPDRRRSL